MGSPARDSCPTIAPWLAPVARRADEVQFGLGREGVVVNGVTVTEARLLARLDGSVSRRDSFHVAASAGVASRRWRELLELVDGLGVLLPAGRAVGARWRPATARARAGLGGVAGELPVVVCGHGDLTDEVIATLRRTSGDRLGVTHVDTSALHPADGLEQPGLVVTVADGALDPRRGDEWLRRGVAHLPVVPIGPTITVGPLVDPSSHGPCLWCLDLHRTDRDRAWPTLMAQLVGGDGPSRTPDDGAGVAESGPAAADACLRQLVAGSVSLLVARLAGGQSPPPGISFELSLPWPRMDHRRWTVHPLCPRHPRPRSRTSAVA